MKAENILIEQPEKQSRLRRVGYAIVTIVAWVLWTLLWLPALRKVVASLGFGTAMNRWVPDVVLSGARDLVQVVWIAPVALLVFLVWSYREGRRIQGERRRREARPVPITETAESLHTSTGEALRIQDSRRAVLHVDDEGHIAVSSADALPVNVTDLNEKRRQVG